MHESEVGLVALEESTDKKVLSIPTRKRLMSLVADFIIELYGKKVNVEEVRAVSREVVDIFPSLKVEPSKIGGIVCIMYFLI